jgi:hypothetical protein
VTAGRRHLTNGEGERINGRREPITAGGELTRESGHLGTGSDLLIAGRRDNQHWQEMLGGGRAALEAASVVLIFVGDVLTSAEVVLTPVSPHHSRSAMRAGSGC